MTAYSGIFDTVDMPPDPPVCIEQDFEHDAYRIKCGDKTALIPKYLAAPDMQWRAVRDALTMVGMNPFEVERFMKSHLRPGTCYNDINTIYGAGMLNPFGWKEYGNAAYRATMPKRFPRSDKELDAIMMRRVNARLQLQQEKIFRHWKHVGIVALVVVFAPLIVAAVLRLWGASLAWIAA
jgi:hypothetical protein